MNTLTIDVQGWPEQYVRLLERYAEEIRQTLVQQGLPRALEEAKRQELLASGVLRQGTQHLAGELCVPPGGPAPSGVLEDLLAERQQGR